MNIRQCRGSSAPSQVELPLHRVRFASPFSCRGDVCARVWQDALALILRHPAADLPRSIEDGATPPADLSDYENPLVVVIPFERVPAAKAPWSASRGDSVA